MGKHRSPTSISIRARQVRHALSQIHPANCHPQRQCILFHKIPPELRTLIFEFALAEHDDTSRPLVALGADVRPGHVWEPRLYTDLCQTCKLIYYETSSMPMRSATFKYFVGYRPNESWTVGLDLSKQRLRLKSEAFPNFTAKQTRDFTAMTYVGPLFRINCRAFDFPQFRPSIITIELRPFVRRLDQWQQVHPFATSITWRENDIRRIEPTAMWQIAPLDFAVPSSLRELRLILECIHADRPKLHNFLEGIGTQVVAVQGKDGYLSTSGHAIMWRSWWILPGQQPTGPDGKYEWQQRCYARLTYTHDEAAPLCPLGLSHWPRLEMPSELIEYLQRSASKHRVEKETRHTEGREDCSYVRWMKAVAAQKNQSESLQSLLPALDAPSRDWAEVTSGTVRV